MPDLGLYDKHHAWVMRVMLAAFREQGLTFDAAWASAIQRMRAQPTMTPEQVQDLEAAKEQLRWSKEVWRWAYDGLPEPPPSLVAERAQERRRASAAALAQAILSPPAESRRGRAPARPAS